MPGAGDYGSQLRKLRPEWWQYNLNYDELNKRLIEVKREFGLRKALSSRSLTGETRTFAEILDQDVEKIVMFYLRAQGDLGESISLQLLSDKQILTIWLLLSFLFIAFQQRDYGT